MSAAAAKGYPGSRQKVPRPGTRTRQLHDLFLRHKGIVLERALTKQESYILAQLRDVYGLDIVKLGYKRWVLAGEWFGSDYVDYIARKL